MTTYVTYSEDGAVFNDGTTLSGTWTAEYDDNDNLVSVDNIQLTATNGSSSTVFTTFGGIQAGTGNSSPNSSTFYQVLLGTGDTNSFYNLYLDWTGTNPTGLSTGESEYTSIVNNTTGSPVTVSLSSATPGSIAYTGYAIVSNVENAVFQNGATLSGTWTTYYDASNTIVGVTNVSIVVTASDGSSSTFTSAYTPNGGTADEAGNYQILAGGTSGGPFSYLYLDWSGTAPTTLSSTTDGSGEYTSVFYSPTDGTSATLPLTVGGSVTDSTACFGAGTLIATPRGDVAVETLQPGDTVLLADGSQGFVTWIGHRRLRPHAFGRPDTVQPILVECHAFGPGCPHADLVVSPDHGLAFENHLVPAKALLTGGNVRQLDVDVIDYYHVELREHAVLLANGLPAESYLDTGNRSSFANGASTVVLRPDFAQLVREVAGCMPFVESGAVVERVRTALLARMALQTTREAECRIVYKADHAVVVSRTAIPGYMTPDPRDRRVLGVKVASLTLDGVPVPLDHPALTQGWHAMEPDGRWTDGAAIIPGTLLAGRDVQLSLAATTIYRLAKAA